MAERHPNGYVDTKRQEIGYRDGHERRRDYREIYAAEWSEPGVKSQARRCMDCGVPTCVGSCPIANHIPDWNDLISRGDWRGGLVRLHATNNFPEFTGYTCPAPCEPACVLALDGGAVTIKSIERAIVDRGWEAGWIVPQPPARRSGFRVAVVGSGPAGLAAAQQLNRAGHRVAVFERDDVAGGLLSYGIPDFKLAKHRVTRRLRQLEQEGIEFVTRTAVGRDVALAELRGSFDAVCLAVGALQPRPVDLPGRDLAGVEYAMRYLVQENRRQAGRTVENPVSATGGRVVVVGGGDTGADCVATANRQGASCVTQIDINTMRPLMRPANNPWPEPPLTALHTYAKEEGCVEEYGFEALAFVPRPDSSRVAAVVGQRVRWTYSSRRRRLDKEVLATGIRVPADLVLLATGFAGPEVDAFAGELEMAANGTIATDAGMQTNLAGVFAAGDANLGASIVVWAIGEGRDAARAIDIYLTGDSMLPASIRTANKPTQWQLEEEA